MASKHVDPMSEAALMIVNNEDRAELEKMSEKSRREVSIAALSQAKGRIESSNLIHTQTKLFALMELRRVKESKLYKNLGLTWAQYCDQVGVKRRTIDEQLLDLSPFADEFLAAFRQFTGGGFNKIKQLGMAVSGGSAEIEGNAIVYEGEKVEIAADNVEAVQEVLDRISSDHGRRADEAEAEAAAQKRVTADKTKLIRKLEKRTETLERKAEKEGLTPEEAGFRLDMENMKITFDGLCARVDPEGLATEFGDAMTSPMKAELVATLSYMVTATKALYDTATDMYGEPGE